MKNMAILSKKHQSKNGCVIFRKHLDPLIQRAVKAAEPAGNEICGVIVSNGFCLELVLTKNKSNVPGSFELPLRRVRKIKQAARRVNHKLVGTFHSHPFSSAEPGRSDIEGTVDGTLMLIIACSDKEVRLWRIQNDTAIPISLHYL